MAKTDFADLTTPETAPIGEADLADLQQPDYQSAADGSAYVFNDITGELGTVDPAEVGVLGGSLRLATADDLARHNRIADNSGFGSKMLGRAESFARGATLGLSGLAADAGAGLVNMAMDDSPRAASRGVEAGLDDRSAFERGRTEARAGRLAREEALGSETYLWEGLGAVAPTLLSGGASLGARALAATPADRVFRRSCASEMVSPVRAQIPAKPSPHDSGTHCESSTPAQPATVQLVQFSPVLPSK